MRECPRDERTIQIGQAVVPRGHRFRGIQFELTGQPAAGDSFQVAASATRTCSPRAELHLLARKRRSTRPPGRRKLNNKVGNVLNDLDQAISHVLDVRAQVGSRLNAIDAQRTSTPTSTCTPRRCSHRSRISTTRTLFHG